MEAPLLEAWNQIAWADFLIETGEVDRGRELAETAAATAVRHGARGIEAEARSVTGSLTS
jgi:hypothetical protein